MSRRQNHFIVAAVMLAAFLIGAAPNVPGQGRDRSRTQSDAGAKIPAFKSAGVASKTTGAKELASLPAPKLSIDTLAKLIGKQPGALYVLLTPSQPTVANRGALVFVQPSLVESGEGYVDFSVPPLAEGPPTGHVVLWLKSLGNAKYLIDCFVSGSVPTVPFKVTGPDGSFQTSKLSQAKGHLLFTLDATTAGWYRFEISSGGKINEGGTGYKWHFYSCEVTNL
jgi:hypothetical protein